MFGLSASMKIRSNGPRPSAASCGSVSSAGPRRSSTDAVQPGARDVGARHFGVLRIDLQRDQPAAGGQRPRQPDGAVAAQRADLQDVPRAANARQQVQQLALVRRHVDRRQPRRRAGLQSRPQRGIGRRPADR